MELGGTDQKFNLLMGRELQKQHGGAAGGACDAVAGRAGVNKMSKPGNYIGIAEALAKSFGKVMSISDELMWRWLSCCVQTST